MKEPLSRPEISVKRQCTPNFEREENTGLSTGEYQRLPISKQFKLTRIKK